MDPSWGLRLFLNPSDLSTEHQSKARLKRSGPPFIFLPYQPLASQGARLGQRGKETGATGVHLDLESLRV